jgi:transposase
MEKLSIREASQTFGISRARIYQLLDKGAIIGHLSTKRGRGAGSWVDNNSLSAHIKNRVEKQRRGGRPLARQEGDYLPARVAAHKIGYTRQYINQLVRQGAVVAKKIGGSTLIYYPSLLNYIYKK